MRGLIGTVLVAATIACSDPPEAGLSHDELVARLSAIPGLRVTETPTQTPGYTYFVLRFTLPLDHDDPSRGTFEEQVTLLHRATTADVPVVVHTSGYSNFFPDRPVEVTQLLDANQASIEHRFYGSSVPDTLDWSRLTIRQMAEDEHAIVEALKTIYRGPFVSTGGSKGGMTAIFHRRFYPDDVAGTVAYVAPLSLAPLDARYADFLGTVGPAACRSFVRDVARELIENRRDAMEAKALDQSLHPMGPMPPPRYTQIELGAAVEAAILSLEWSFWQIRGVEACSAVPRPDASDDALFKFLDHTSPISNSADDRIAHAQPYFYQSYTQLGYPDYGAGYLAPYREYDDDDYASELPIAEPTYDPDAMRDIAAYVKSSGSHLLLIYGEWDPWTAGRFELGDAEDAAVFVQPQGNHFSQILQLERSDKDAALAKLQAWTGVTPMPSRVLRTTADLEHEPAKSSIFGE